jgi:hypothetical protein
VGENEPDFEYNTYRIGEAPPSKPTGESKSWFRRITKYFFPSKYEVGWDQVSHTPPLALLHTPPPTPPLEAAIIAPT